MKIAPIFDPEKRRKSPQAQQVDLHVIFLIGTGISLTATVTLGILFFFYSICWHAFLVAVCATLIGIMALIWELFNRHKYRLVALMQQ